MGVSGGVLSGWVPETLGRGREAQARHTLPHSPFRGPDSCPHDTRCLTWGSMPQIQGSRVS